MWCPNCKNEYVPGITRCADCGIPLVETLEESAELATNDATVYEAYEDAADLRPEAADPDDADVTPSPAASAHAYVSQRTKSEDMKSTAYTFTLIGGAGLILLVLFVAGVLPIHTASYMKVMICIVMGAMFFIFLLVGIHAFRQIKKLGDAADTEEALCAEIMAWFPGAYTADAIDAQHSAEDQEEMLYFARYGVMRQLIEKRYPELEESFLDYIIELLYAELF